MANFNPHSPIKDHVTAVADALALKQFGGYVLGAFDNALIAGVHGMKHNMPFGNQWQFPATWKMNSEEHEPGTEMVGNNEPANEERTIVLDDKELVAHVTLSKRDDLISHLSLLPEWGRQAGIALAETYEKYWLQCLCLGARQSARTIAGTSDSFPAGNRLDTARTGASIAAAYPLSLAGSKYAQDDLGQIGQKMDEKNVPKTGRFAFIGPYMSRVFRQDKTLVSRDYQDTNTLLTRQMYLVEGFWLEEANLMPTALIASGPSAYQGDFTTTAMLCMGDNTAVGSVFLEEIDPFGPTWYESRRAWLLGAAMFQGSKWLRPEACGEVQIAG